jgi:hypothetical protein
MQLMLLLLGVMGLRPLVLPVNDVLSIDSLEYK